LRNQNQARAALLLDKVAEVKFHGVLVVAHHYSVLIGCQSEDEKIFETI